MIKDNLTETITKLIEPIIIDNGLELVELELKQGGGHWQLKIFIDSEDGVKLVDCARISRLASTLLDVEDIIPHAYLLEVSSPGL